LRLPRLLRRFAHAIVEGFLPPEFEDAFRRAADEEPLFLGNAVAFWDCEKRDLLRPERHMRRSSGRLIGDLASPFVDREPLDRVIGLELRNRLPELLLMRVDKMSMACSVEARVPFLDEDVVEFALRVPAKFKFRDGQPKYLLKQAARGLVPDEVIYRSKRGFCGSATTMLSDAVTRFARERILASPLVAERFNRPFIERLFERHRRRKRFNSFKIWNLLNLVLWHACWFEETPPTPPPERGAILLTHP
jgi:asparagine synthase (glutamine-hydrolysing)